MQIRTCTLTGWILAAVAVWLLASQAQLGLIAILLLISFLFACGMTRSHHDTLSTGTGSGSLEAKK